MHGTNPIRKPVMDEGLTLAVKEIFPTLQGEGPHAGVPAVFIRLGGCNLACDFCDTDFEGFASKTVEDIMAQVAALQTKEKLAVITGGEPLRQNIAPLCEALMKAGFKVQIETNGTLFRELPPAVEIVCSPKNTSGSYAPLRPDLLGRVNALKFIISASHAGYDAVPDWASGEIYVQPMDEYDAEKNAANREFAAKLARDNNYKLSLRLHKILGIP